MPQNSERLIDLSLLVASARNKRVQRVLDRAQKQRERAHQRQRDRILSKASAIMKAAQGSSAPRALTPTSIETRLGQRTTDQLITQIDLPRAD